MKPKNILSITLLLLLMLFMQHCDDPITELEKLPKATQSGKDTFACLVNGKAWIAEGAGGVAASAYYQTGTLSIYSGLVNKNFDSAIQLHIYDLTLQEKAYPLAVMNRPESNDARYQDDLNVSCEYFTTNDYTGSITITHLDKVNFIISGTFEFTGYSSACDKLIKLTDGRFDIEYAP